jgi:hypothetical protein
MKIIINFLNKIEKIINYRVRNLSFESTLMDHLKYLGKFIPESDNIIITDGYYGEPNVIIIDDDIYSRDLDTSTGPFLFKVPRCEWHVIAAQSDDNEKSLLTIHRDNFSPNDTKKRIYTQRFRMCAMIADADEYYKGNVKERYRGCETWYSYDVDQKKQFAFVYTPGGYCEGVIYQYTNTAKEITALEVKFFFEHH